MSAARLAALVLLALSSAAAAAPQSAAAKPAAPGFAALLRDYTSASAGAPRERALERLAQRRAELNIRNQDVVALALVRHGLSQFEAGDAAAAAESVRGALRLDPDLPEAHFALARVGAGGGLGGYTADVDTRAGRSRGLTFLAACLLFGVLGAVTALGVAALLRHGRLLLHDLRENASSTSLEALAPGLGAVVLLLPLVLFQGWGWLPLWWLAVLFAYMGRGERVGVVLALVLTGLMGPLLTGLEQRQALDEHPLLWSGLRTLQGPADTRDLARLESERRLRPEDRDLAYLVAIQHEKAGEPAAAEAIYRTLLARQPDDAVALNNLAKLEFTGGGGEPATARFRHVGDGSAAARVKGTALYNLSIANLQLFDFDLAADFRRQADAIARSSTRRYESQWSYATPEGSAVSALVSLGPSVSELEAKLAGVSEGVAQENLTGSGARLSALPQGGALLSRLLGFVPVFLVGWLGVRMWRGGLLVTRRCLKCGTPFSRRSRAGAEAAELCNPCYHLYVVKDGISMPARQAKLADVQSWETRSRLAMRLLSLVSPGSGHAFAERSIPGLLLGVAWYAALGALLLLQLGILPLIDAPPSLAGSLPRTLAAVLLAASWLAANLLGPDLDRPLPTARRARRAVA